MTPAQHLEKMHARNVTAERRHDPHSGITLSPRILAFDHAEWHADIAIGARIWTTASEAHYHRADGTVVRPPKRRTSRVKPFSDSRRAEFPVRDLVRAAVFERDGGCVADTWRQPCIGPLTPHHLRKAGQGGAYTEDNLVTLCSMHNGMVEDYPHEATARGLVIKAAAS